MTDKEQDIINYLEERNFRYLKIDEEKDITLVHNAYFNEIFQENVSAIVNHYYGFYYRINGGEEEMLKYYSLAVKQGFEHSMNNLWYYYSANKKYHDAITHYFQLLEAGCSIVTKYLAQCYQDIGNQEEMIKYFLLSITDSHAMLLFGHYYQDIKDYDNAIKYYSLAAELNCDTAPFYIAIIYEKIGDIDKMIEYCQKNITKKYCVGKLVKYYISINDETNMIKYCQIGIDLGNGSVASNLGGYYYEKRNFREALKYFLKAFELDGYCAAYNLSFCYDTLGDYDNMKKYALMMIKHGNFNYPDALLNNPENILEMFIANKELFDDKNHIKSLLILLEQLINNNGLNNDLIAIIKYINIKYFLQYFGTHKLLYSYKKLLDEQINLIDLHFNYAPDGKGCNKAKEDFLTRLV